MAGKTDPVNPPFLQLRLIYRQATSRAVTILTGPLDFNPRWHLPWGLTWLYFQDRLQKGA